MTTPQNLTPRILYPKTHLRARNLNKSNIPGGFTRIIMSITTVTSRCAACRNQRRRCPPDCIFSPHFPSTDPERFDAVHRVYGASKVAKMIEGILPEMRAQAADALHFEAKCRIQDPIYGCVGIISMLNEEIRHTGTELAKLRARISFLASDAREEPKEVGWDYTAYHLTEQINVTQQDLRDQGP